MQGDFEKISYFPLSARTCGITACERAILITGAGRTRCPGPNKQEVNFHVQREKREEPAEPESAAAAEPAAEAGQVSRCLCRRAGG